MSESGEPPVLLSDLRSNQSHITTKDAFSTNDEDAGIDTAQTRVAMLSERLYSLGPFGGSSVYFLAVASISRRFTTTDLQTSVPSPSHSSIGTTSSEKTNQHFPLEQLPGDIFPTPVRPDLFPQIDSITPPAATSSNLRIWRCPACSAEYGRSQDCKRHIIRHLPYWIHCPLPQCSWTGNRIDIFRRHYAEHDHHGPYDRVPKREAFEIYDPRELIDRIRDGTVNVDVAADIALGLVRVKAEQLQKPSLLTNPIANKYLASSSSVGSLPVTDSEPNKQHDQTMHVERHLVSGDGSAHGTSASWAGWAEDESWVEPAYRMQDQVNEG
jgi:hypothetical protein